VQVTDTNHFRLAVRCRRAARWAARFCKTSASSLWICSS